MRLQIIFYWFCTLDFHKFSFFGDIDWTALYLYSSFEYGFKIIKHAQRTNKEDTSVLYTTVRDILIFFFFCTNHWSRELAAITSLQTDGVRIRLNLNRHVLSLIINICSNFHCYRGFFQFCMHSPENAQTYRCLKFIPFFITSQTNTAILRLEGDFKTKTTTEQSP